MDEELLVENFRKERSANNFEHLFRKYQPRLYNVAYRMVGSHEDAEEMVQETFLRVYTGFDQLHRGSSFYAWLLCISNNLCRDLMRVRQRRLSRHLFSLDQNNNSNTAIVAEASNRNTGPACKLEELEKAVVIEQSLARLPVDQRVAVVLRDIEGLPYHQIAMITGTKPGTVRSRLYYARLKLRMLLEPYVNGRPFAGGLIVHSPVQLVPVPVSWRSVR